MQRRYVGVNTVGNPTEIFERIRGVVQAQKQTRLIPAVKIERRPRRQFYVFLAVDDAEGERLPDEVVTILQRVGLSGRRLWPIEPASVRSMTSSTELETHALNTLAYTSLWSNDAGDPFDLSDMPFNAINIDDTSLGERYDLLVIWLSASAEGTWRTFARVCAVLKLTDDTKKARSIFRRLILLGYIESSDDGQKWSICPSTLVQCAVDSEVRFLTGQRAPKLIAQLGTCFSCETIPQPGYEGPSCVKCHGGLLADSLVQELQIGSVGVASVQLAKLLPDLVGWKDTLVTIDRFNTARYDEIEIWNGDRYITCDTFYERDGQYFGDAGMYRLTKGIGTNASQIILYFDQSNQRWLRGDWYGLRFLAADNDGRDFELIYDSSNNDILIPAAERWPLLYERALALASGMLPSPAENPKWLRYSGVSNELVQLLTEKLNVSITEIQHA